MINALTTSNLEDSLFLEEIPEETSVKNRDKMNRVVYGVIRSNTRYKVSCDD